jgi:hypothetical protein
LINSRRGRRFTPSKRRTAAYIALAYLLLKRGRDRLAEGGAGGQGRLCAYHQRNAGVVSYFILVPSERQEDIVSVSVFEDQQSAEESNTIAAEWVAQNLSELLRSTPEFASGQLVVYEASQ